MIGAATFTRPGFEHPISPETFRSRTHGNPLTVKYITFSRSGTDSHAFPSSVAERRWQESKTMEMKKEEQEKEKEEWDIMVNFPTALDF